MDYVITHCAPTSIALMENRHNEADPLTDFLQEVKERAHYHYWLFGHYHDNRAIDEKHISRAWSGMSTRQYKNLKGLKKENLRDNMTTLELVLNMLAEATTTQFSRDRKPTTFQENLAVAKAGGQVAGRTRKDIESQSDTPVITAKNAAQLNQVVTDLLEGAVSDTTEESKDK